MNNILAVLFDGVVYASWLFLMAAATLIYGVMKILNIAHGSLYALGAYTAATIAGAWLAAGACRRRQLRHARARGAARRRCGGGPLLERGLLKWMYGRDEVVLFITYAVFLILEDTIKLVWGVESQLLPEPYALRQFSDRHPRVSRLQPSAGRSGTACGTRARLGALSDAPGVAARRDPRPRDQRRHGHQRGPCLPRHLQRRRDAGGPGWRAHSADDRGLAGHQWK